jgi:Cohesin domain
MWLCSAPYASSQISLSNQTAAPGSSILFPLTFAAHGASVSGVQLDLEDDGANLSLTTTVDDALKQSEKNLFAVDLASNHKRVLIVGQNQNQIPDGTLLNLFVNVSATAPQGLYSLKISSTVGTNPNSLASSVLATSGTLTVATSGSATPL